MIKTTLLAMFAVSVLLTGTVAGTAVLVQPAEALKGQGVSSAQYGKSTKNIVCGDRLCSEVEQEQKPKEEKKKKEQVKQEKKSKESEKTIDHPLRDKKAEKMAADTTSRDAKTVTGIVTSVQDPGQGHEGHQLAIILQPSKNVYRGHLSYAASENVQLVALHGPLKQGMTKGQATWTPDGKTIYGLTFVDNEKSSGFWQFSGNALALHTKNTEPFSATYAVTYTELSQEYDNVMMDTKTSKQDQGIGHENHQLVLVLPFSDEPYRGNITFDASKPVQMISLIGPLPEGLPPGMQTWSADGESHYGMVFGPSKSAGSMVFSGNAFGFHSTESEPFTISYSLVLTR